MTKLITCRECGAPREDTPEERLLEAIFGQGICGPCLDKKDE